MENTDYKDMDISSSEFLNLFTDITNRIVKERNENNGNLPKEVWLKLLEASGSYLCAELFLVSPNGNPVLKIRKDSTARNGELEWDGKLHIPGSFVGNKKSDEILPFLLRNEISNEEVNIDSLLKNTRLVAFAKYPEPERKTVADTLLFMILLDEKQMGLLQSDFVEITNEKLAMVIEQHKPIIEWFKNGMPTFMIDTRFQ